MRYIYICCISLTLGFLSAQDSLEVKKKLNFEDFQFSIGTDLAAPVMGLFTDRNGYSILVNAQLYKKWTVQFQGGWEQNTYEDIGWDVKVDGSYWKLGANYIISRDLLDLNNQFYVGGKIAYAPFTQDLNQVPIRALGQTTQYVNLGTDKASALWLEIPLGARVNIFRKKLYLEAIMSSNVLISTSSEIDIDPVVIPSFGRDNGGINFNLFWGLTYVIL